MACLIIPGLHSSGPDHWQTVWERELGDCQRADLRDWDQPRLADWIAGVGRAIEKIGGYPVLVAHSLGCMATVWWATVACKTSIRVVGALLVAPPDVEREDADPRLRRFAPTPMRSMPFPTIVVASRNDPYASFERSREMADAWSARFHDAGEVGHLNAASGLGRWEEGRRLVAELAAVASLDGNRRRSFITETAR